MRSPRPTYANVTSTLALFVALGGVSWAATTLPRNSVGSAQLKRNAVTASDVRLDGITSAAVPAGTRVVSIVGNCELGVGDGGTVQAASFKAVVLGS